MINLFKALSFKLKSIPYNFCFLLYLVNYLLFISCLLCLRIVQNLNIHGMVVLLPWSPTRIKGPPNLLASMWWLCLLSKCWRNNHLAIELANPPWPLMDPIYIFHGIIQWYFSMITFIWNHLSPYNFFIKPTSLHYEGITIKWTLKP